MTNTTALASSCQPLAIPFQHLSHYMTRQSNSDSSFIQHPASPSSTRTQAFPGGLLSPLHPASAPSIFLESLIYSYIFQYCSKTFQEGSIYSYLFQYLYPALSRRVVSILISSSTVSCTFREGCIYSYLPPFPSLDFFAKPILFYIFILRASFFPFVCHAVTGEPVIPATKLPPAPRRS